MDRSSHRPALSTTTPLVALTLLLGLGAAGCSSPAAGVVVTLATAEASLGGSSAGALLRWIPAGPARQLLASALRSSRSVVPADEGDSDNGSGDSVLDQLRRKREERRKQQGQPARQVVPQDAVDEESPATPPKRHVAQDEPGRGSSRRGAAGGREARRGAARQEGPTWEEAGGTTAPREGSRGQEARGREKRRQATRVRGATRRRGAGGGVDTEAR